MDTTRKHPSNPPSSLWSVLNSWEDGDANRYFPQQCWTGWSDLVEVQVRDGCTGEDRPVLRVSLPQAIEAGLKPRIELWTSLELEPPTGVTQLSRLLETVASSFLPKYEGALTT